MNKITTERGKELLEEIKYNRENCFLSEKTKILMDIAESVILEQQERGEGEWIEWGGGDCPVDKNAKVEFKSPGGAAGLQRAKYLNWFHNGAGDDIIAYRIIQERATNQNGEQ